MRPRCRAPEDQRLSHPHPTPNLKVAIFPTLLAGGWIWERQLPVFAEFGLEARAVAEPFVNFDAEPTVAGMVAACRAIIADHPGPWILVGNSFGGMIAMKLAVALPDQVVAVVAGGAPGMGEMANLGIGTRAMLSPAYANQIRDKLFAVPRRATPQLVRQALDKVRGRRAAVAGVRLLRSVRGLDMSGTLAALACPTALIWGEQDQVTPAAPWREAVRGSPNIAFHAIEDAGHCPMFETPDAFNTHLRAFLASIVTERPS